MIERLPIFVRVIIMNPHLARIEMSVVGFMKLRV